MRLKTFRPSNMLRALRSRNYRLYFTGQMVSLVGSAMQMTALLWLVNTMYEEERTAAFWLGVVGFAGPIPSLVCAPIAGALADRWNRRTIILVTQVLAMGQAAILAVLALGGWITIIHVVVLSAWMGVVFSFEIPARQAFVVEMIDNPEDLTNAIAMNSSILHGGRLLGAALGGLLTAFFGAGVCFLLNAVTFLAVIAALLLMRFPPRVKVDSPPRVMRHLVEGWLYSARHPAISSMLLLAGLVSLMGFSYSSLLPVFVRHVLGAGSGGYGALVSATAVGALVGAGYLAGRMHVRGLERILASGPILIGAGMIAFALSRSFTLSLALMPILGIGQILLMSSINTLIQTLVDDDKRGRVMSLYSLTFMGLMPIGSLLMGVLSKWIGPPLTVLTGGAACVLGGLWFLSHVERVRLEVEAKHGRGGIGADRADEPDRVDGVNDSETGRDARHMSPPAEPAE